MNRRHLQEGQRSSISNFWISKMKVLTSMMSGHSGLNVPSSQIYGSSRQHSRRLRSAPQSWRSDVVLLIKASLIAKMKHQLKGVMLLRCTSIAQDWGIPKATLTMPNLLMSRSRDFLCAQADLSSIRDFQTYKEKSSPSKANSQLETIHNTKEADKTWS